MEGKGGKQGYCWKRRRKSRGYARITTFREQTSRMNKMDKGCKRRRARVKEKGIECYFLFLQGTERENESESESERLQIRGNKKKIREANTQFCFGNSTGNWTLDFAIFS